MLEVGLALSVQAAVRLNKEVTVAPIHEVAF